MITVGLSVLALKCSAFMASALDDTIGPDTAVAAHYPPLMVEGNVETPGYAVEILRKAAAYMDRDLSVEFLPFQRAMFMVRESTNTLMPALFRNDSREDDFQWIVQINSAKLSFVTTTMPVKNLEQARALDQIVVENGSSNERLLQGLGFKNLTQTNGPVASAEMLASGRADAWFLTEQLATDTWKRRGFNADLVFGDVMFELPIYLAAGLDFPADLAAEYRTVIEGMVARGEIAALIEKYQ